MVTLNDLIASCYAGTAITSEVVKKALEKKGEAMAERAANACCAILDFGEQALAQSIEYLRNVRQSEKRATKTVTTIDRAFRYFGETGNPLPLFRATSNERMGADFCQKVGIKMPEQTDAAWEVPEDWKPAEPVAVSE